MPEPAEVLRSRASAHADVARITPAAREGDPDAQNQLGNAYRNAGDHEEALSWYIKSADQNWPNAMGNLAINFTLGLGVETDPSKAAEWWIKAAELDFPPACLEAGLAYIEGHGIQSNHKLALRFFAQGSDLGNANCAYNAGYIQSGFAAESTLPADLPRAAAFLREAIRLGFDGPGALHYLALVENQIKIDELMHMPIEQPINTHSSLEGAEDLQSTLIAAGGFRCPSCNLHAGCKMDAKMRGGSVP